ncbi:hypothetical protein RYX36_028746 [Vicia faba]
MDEKEFLKWKRIVCRHFRGSFRKIVTNTGIPNSIYTKNVTAPKGLLHISMNPTFLSFSSVGEKHLYNISSLYMQK